MYPPPAPWPPRYADDSGTHWLRPQIRTPAEALLLPWIVGWSESVISEKVKIFE